MVCSIWMLACPASAQRLPLPPVQALLGAGAEVNLAADSSGNTALHLAAARGYSVLTLELMDRRVPAAGGGFLDWRAVRAVLD